MSLTVKPPQIVAEAEESGRPGLLGIAAHWGRVALGDIADVINGAPFPSTGFNDAGHGLPLVRIRDVTSGWTGMYFEGEYEEQHLVTPGDLLVGMDGDFSVRRWDGKPGLLNQRVCKLVVRDSALYDDRFLEYVLPGYLDAIGQRTSSITVKHLSSRDLQTIPLPLPPRAEQLRIVAALEGHLSRLDGVMRSVAGIQNMLRAARQRTLTYAVRGALPGDDEHRSEGGAARELVEQRCRERGVARPPDERPSSIPETWGWARIGDLFDVFVGTTPSRKDPQLWGGGIPWVSSGEVAFNRINRTRETITAQAVGNSSKRLHPPGTVMLAMIGEGKTRGQAAILDVEAAHNQNCASIRVPGSGVLSEWVYWCLVERYDRTRRQAAGNNQPALNKARVQEIELPIPPAPTQGVLVAHMERVADTVTATSTALEALAARCDALRRSLLLAAFRGRLVNQDDGDEPAELLLQRIVEDRTVALPARRRGRIRPVVSTAPECVGTGPVEESA